MLAAAAARGEPQAAKVAVRDPILFAKLLNRVVRNSF